MTDAVRRATLEDVAKLAEVSTSTVSRCLHKPEMVVAETREKVIWAVKRLHYIPNFGAQALAGRKIRTVGAIIPTMADAVFSEGVEAFEKAMSAAGASLVVSTSGYDRNSERQHIENLVGRGVDGILLVGTCRSEDDYAYMADNQIPSVLTWTSKLKPGSHCVGFDNVKAMKEMARTVLSFGHRQIAMISGPQENNDRVQDRIAGAREALMDFDIAPEALQVVEVAYGIEEGGIAFRKIMEESQPTAILCGNDVLAAGAILMARKMRLKVPADVSITGFDDIHVSTIVSPELTTVRIPHAEMGRRAAETLLALIDRREQPSSIELDAKVIVRQSLARRAP